MTNPPPKLSGALETSLYAADFEASTAFYRDVIGLRPFEASKRLVVFEAGPKSVLLLFQRGATLEDIINEEGCVPGHEGAGRLHIAFAIEADAYGAWKAIFRPMTFPSPVR